MFNKNFYPTPVEVIIKMTSDLPRYGKSKVLEPSCGKGNILDFLSKNGISKEYLYAIEREKELSNIVKSKGYNFLSYDFLSYDSEERFDYIIMNPPFDNGVKHLLHAWEISKGAEIRCLLNSESIYNPYSKERKILLELIKKYGEVEHLGECFNTPSSERKTNVKVSLIKLKNTAYKSEFEFESKFKTEKKESFEEIEDFSLATKDKLYNFEADFKKVTELTKDLFKLTKELEYYSKGLISDPCSLISKELDSYKNTDEKFSSTIKNYKKSAWNTIYSKLGISNFLTSKVRDEFYNKKIQQENVEFSKENIQILLEELFMRKDKMMYDCIEEQFDILTMYSHKNKVYKEGWKTNSKWMINKKIIIPNMIEPYFHDENIPKLKNSDRIIDFEKSIAFITKKSFENTKSIYKLFNEGKICEFGKWYENENFKFKAFKKGTIHLEFKSSIVHQAFNEIACRNKNWIGEKEA